MDVEDALRLRLTGAGVLAARLAEWLGAPAVFWLLRPQNSGLPAIVLTTVSRPEAEHMQGPQALQFMRVQVDSYAASVIDAQQVADLAIAALRPRAFAHGYYFRPASVLARRDMGDPGMNGGTFRVSMDLMVRFSPA